MTDIEFWDRKVPWESYTVSTAGIKSEPTTYITISEYTKKTNISVTKPINLTTDSFITIILKLLWQECHR